MFITILFAIFSASVFPHDKIKGNYLLQKTFTFMTSQNNKITLEKPSTYFPKKGVQSTFMIRKKILSTEGWYYVHFLTNNLQEISKIAKIKAENAIVKNTFILYLTEDELSKITNISLVKKLLPEDKFQESEKKLSNTNYFHVITKHGCKIPTKSDFYSIERQDAQDTYIIRVDRNNENDDEFLNKKKNAIKELSQIQTVKTISTFTLPTFANSIMAGYTQRNQPLSSILTDKKTGTRYLERYVNNKGITGAGEIISILDTPIDFYHAMFRDDKVSMQLNSPLKDHRKFVYYSSSSQSLDDWSARLATNEHGTIMAAIAAGKSICSDDSNLFNGNAPDSKILYAGNPKEVSAQSLVSLMKNYESFISSNSWGIDNYNDQFNYEYGNLAQRNSERLFIFAAGNSYTKGNFTIGDPGSSKNVLTVGSIGSFYNPRPSYKIQSKTTGTTVVVQAISDCDPWIEGTFGSLLSNDITAIDGTRTGQCHLLNSGHVSVVYASNPAAVNWVYGCQLTSSTGILYSQSPGDIINLINEGGRVIISDVTPIEPDSKIEHAAFSSGGPGSKGILKPDVSAPGTRIISAKSIQGGRSNHGCSYESGGNFTTTHGTSTSAANIAGAAALVRQYFISGQWKVKAELDGTTLRALIINSCKHPHGSKSPDVLFGHGIVDLSTILPLDGSFGVQITPTRQMGNKPSVGEKSHVSATISVKPNGKPLQITLSYLDPMLDQSSPIPITRDLDLIVISPSNQMFKGDHLSNGDTQHFSTNEKIIIDQPESGTYYIHVVGGDFADVETPSGLQDFAVAVSGPVSDGLLNFAKPTTCPCTNCDPSNPTHCLCSDTQIGPACQAEVVKSGAKHIANVGPLQMTRVRIASRKEIKSVLVSSYNPGAGSTVWVAPTCELSLSKYEINSKTGNQINVTYGSNELCVAVFNNNYKEAEYLIEAKGEDGGVDPDDGTNPTDGTSPDDGTDDGNSGNGNGKKKNKKGVIIGVVIAVIVVLAAAAVVAYIFIKRRNPYDQNSSLLTAGLV